MAWRHKKAEPTPIIQIPESPPPCQHKWYDFSWYIEISFSTYANKNNGRGHGCIKIVEPYVCCWCKERENHVLEKRTFENVTLEEILMVEKELRDRYSEYINDRAIVEDQIKDMQQNIDRQYLEIIARCFPEKLGLTPEQKRKLELTLGE